MRTCAPLLFLALAACGPAPIEDIVWRPNLEQVPQAYVVFTSDGRLQASDGCNTTRSTFARTGDTVTVEPGSWTGAVCSTAPTAYLGWLFDPSLRVSLGGELTITASDGAHLLKAPNGDTATAHGLDGTWIVESTTHAQPNTVVNNHLQFLGRTFTLADARTGVAGFSGKGVNLVWTVTVGQSLLSDAQQALLASTSWEKRDAALVFHSGGDEFVLGR